MSDCVNCANGITMDPAEVGSIMISALALLVSALTAAYTYLINRRKIDLSVINYRKMKKDYYIFNIEILNGSRLPIPISEMSANINKKKYAFDKVPRKTTATRSSAAFPINIDGLSAKQCFLILRCEDEVPTVFRIKFCTNRGAINYVARLDVSCKSEDAFIKDVKNY